MRFNRNINWKHFDLRNMTKEENVWYLAKVACSPQKNVPLNEFCMREKKEIVQKCLSYLMWCKTMPSCGSRSSCKKKTYLSQLLSISSQAALRDGWRSPLHCLQCPQFWCVEFAQKRTNQTWWRLHLCCPHPPSLTPMAPLTELHLSTVSVESCGQTVAWEVSESGWRSSPEFWTGRRNKGQTYGIHKYSYPVWNNPVNKHQMYCR